MLFQAFVLIFSGIVIMGCNDDANVECLASITDTEDTLEKCAESDNACLCGATSKFEATYDETCRDFEDSDDEVRNRLAVYNLKWGETVAFCRVERSAYVVDDRQFIHDGPVAQMEKAAWAIVGASLVALVAGLGHWRALRQGAQKAESVEAARQGQQETEMTADAYL